MLPAQERVGDESTAPIGPAPRPQRPAHLQMWRGETMYAGDGDLIFRSLRRNLRGKKPPAANMLVENHLRPAAARAGVQAPPRAFGFHTFRRTLASVLVANNVDPKVVQEALRHQNIRTTLELYAKGITSNKLAAQGMFLERLFDEGQRERERKLAEAVPAELEKLRQLPPATEQVQ